MFESIMRFFKKMSKKEEKPTNSKDAAKERLHLVLMQDRANVSADFLELMKQEIIEVIKKYIDIDEKAIDVRLTNKENEDGTNGAPALYANIPILNIKNDARKIENKEKQEVKEEQEKVENEETVKKETDKDKDKEKQEKVEEIIINEPEEDNKKENKNEEEIKSKLENEKNDNENNSKDEVKSEN